MSAHICQRGFLVAFLLVTGSASCADAKSDVAVKKSEARICHERGTPGYKQTKHFKAFDSIQACLKSGGRLPKNSAAKARFDPTKPAHEGDEGVLYGPLDRVIDGDTLVVKIQGAPIHVRLAGVDAPEADQPFGGEARKELASLIGEQTCVLVYEEGDNYGRLVAHLWIGDSYVNAEMVKRGMGWFDSQSGSNDLLFSEEGKARDAKRGLWALPLEDRVEPWVWQQDRR